MTHQEINLRTKERLSESLKKLLKTKPFDKITVSELIRDSDVNRKTFYYHFGSVGDLLLWTLRRESDGIIQRLSDVPESFEKYILYMLQYFSSVPFLLQCSYDTFASEQILIFFYQDIESAAKVILDSLEREQGIHFQEDFKAYLCEIVRGAIITCLKDWMQNNPRREIWEHVEYSRHVLDFFVSGVKQTIEGMDEAGKAKILRPFS